MSDSPNPSARDAHGGPARTLPAKPSMEHLRKEAKARLDALCASDPNAQLADAQRAVARDYGFPSWRQLKAFVDAVHDVGQRLVNAVKVGDVRTMGKILDAHPQLVDATTDMDERLHPIDTRAMRLIHVAISDNQVEAARLLIARGASLNVRNADGRLPLHDCYELGRDEIKDLLIAGGAEIDVIAATAYRMIDRLRDILGGDPGRANDRTTNLSPLGWCGYGGDPGVAELLIKHGAIVDRPPFDELAWNSTAQVGNTGVARVLLSAGANPNWQNDDGDTPIHLAIKSRMVADPLEFVKLLLKRGADVNRRNRAGRTALDEAIAQEGAPIETYFPRQSIGTKRLDRTIELLRSHTSGEDQDRVNEFTRAAEEGRLDELRRMLGADPGLLNRTGSDIYGQTALHKAAWRNHAECVRFLLDRGASVHVRDRGDNAYALHFAAENADLSVVRMLVESGSDVIGEGDDHRVGVLGWATCLAGGVRDDVAAYLIAHGAQFNIWSAIALGRADVVRDLVARDRDVLNARLSDSDHRRTPLHQAVKSNQVEIVDLLLQLGADAAARDSLGRTPLATATRATDRRITDALVAATGELDLAEALVAERFDIAERELATDPARIRPGGRDERALALAVLQESPRSVRWLLEHGADVNAKVVIWKHPVAPLHLAVAQGNVSIVKLLIDAGADLTLRDDEYNATPADWARHLGKLDILALFQR